MPGPHLWPTSEAQRGRCRPGTVGAPRKCALFRQRRGIKLLNRGMDEEVEESMNGETVTCTGGWSSVWMDKEICNHESHITGLDGTLVAVQPQDVLPSG